MMNMGYCRFENTSLAFDECADAIEEITNGNAPALSPSETRAAKNLLRQAIDLLQLVAEEAAVEVELDELESKVDQIVDQINQGADYTGESED